jgi:hypothetical protein
VTERVTAQAVTATDNMFVAQYQALRTEILQLMQSNEQRTLGTLGISGVLWSVLVTLLGSKVAVPGVAFLGPLPLALAGINSYVAVSRRIANIGSFLGAATQHYAPTLPNWEHEVGLYSQRPNNRMSTRMSTVGLYGMMIAIGMVAAITTASAGLSTRPWAWLDLIGSVILGSVAAVSFIVIQRSHQAFAETRRQLDSYWHTRLTNSQNPKDLDVPENERA